MTNVDDTPKLPTNYTCASSSVTHTRSGFVEDSQLTSELCEYAQRIWKQPPNFVEQPDGDLEDGVIPRFESIVTMPDKRVFRASGRNKKSARAEASSVALFHYLFERAPVHEDFDAHIMLTNVKTKEAAPVPLVIRYDYYDDKSTKIRVCTFGKDMKDVVLHERVIRN